MNKVTRRTNATGSAVSDLYFTLAERPYSGSDYILMQLIGKENNDDLTVVLGTDISTNPVRYNQYTVTDSGSQDLTNAVVDFNQSSYDYFIYSSVSQSIQPDSILLEKGLLKVDGLISETVTTLSDNNNEYTFI